MLDARISQEQYGEILQEERKREHTEIDESDSEEEEQEIEEGTDFFFKSI